jgi:uncharacterized protein (TIGR00255 family)
MTGYGSGEVLCTDFQMVVEVKSYNNRFLDILHTIPCYLAPFEAEIDEEVKKVAKRGHVEVSVKIRLLKNDVSLVVDTQAVKQYAKAYDSIISESGFNIKPELSDFLSVEGIVSSVNATDSERFKPVLFQCLTHALDQFGASKAREGEATKQDLKEKAEDIKEGLSVVSTYADELESMIRKNLTERIEEMLGDAGYDRNRILQEVALMLVKQSINEEIKRLGIHLREFDKLLEKDGPVGKRMDFLCQEMNREINTIGSKSQIAELNLQVVRMKDSLENIREQVRNVE